MVKIIFVCGGNVARSQMAEAYYNHFTNSHDATSAGISATTPIQYPILPGIIVDVMQEDGIDISRQKVKQITNEMINLADIIIVIREKSLHTSLLIENPKTIYWNIEDPYKTTIYETREIRDIIKKHVVDFIKRNTL